MVNPDRILVIRTDRIGDVVLTTPALKALRQAFVHAHITLMVSPATYDLVAGLPYIDEVIVDDREGEYRGVFGFLKLCRKIRFLNADTAVIFHTKRRYNLACFFAGIPIRLGYKNNKLGGLLTHPVTDERHHGNKHEAQYCLDLVKELGVQSVDLDLCVAHSKAATEWALSWYKEHVPDNFQLIAIHPGASDMTKCWPASHFAQLIDRIHQRFQVKVVIIGSGSTSHIAKQIKQTTTSMVIDLTEQTSLAQVVALLGLSKILISNDSGPVHIASAVGCSVVSLFLRDQPGINPERWKPLGAQSITLVNKPGEAIRLNASGHVFEGQLSSITVQEVITTIEELMRRNIQSTFLW